MVLFSKGAGIQFPLHVCFMVVCFMVVFEGMCFPVCGGIP